MKRYLAIALVLAGTAGCFGENPQQMIETAQFEEVQRNYPHARQIYQRVLADHPDTPQAKIAAE
ncbi:MAG TPA: hypothetical protein VEB21_19720, partial [Terriglobales bacterium]|nr:hypothetical protein [Terriglobales bacterium]